jgi:chromosome segregation ATPase
VLDYKIKELKKDIGPRELQIQSLNEQIAEVERSIQECQNAFEELVKRELGELHEQKNHYKAKYEEAKYRSRDLMTQIDDFKKRFIQQSKQMHANKERQKALEKERYRVDEQKNYLEKETQELDKNLENLKLIQSNLLEEVQQFKKDC